MGMLRHTDRHRVDFLMGDGYVCGAGEDPGFGQDGRGQPKPQPKGDSPVHSSLPTQYVSVQKIQRLGWVWDLVRGVSLGPCGSAPDLELVGGGRADSLCALKVNLEFIPTCQLNISCSQQQNGLIFFGGGVEDEETNPTRPPLTRPALKEMLSCCVHCPNHGFYVRRPRVFSHAQLQGSSDRQWRTRNAREAPRNGAQ